MQFVAHPRYPLLNLIYAQNGLATAGIDTLNVRGDIPVSDIDSLEILSSKKGSKGKKAAKKLGPFIVHHLLQSEERYSASPQITALLSGLESELKKMEQGTGAQLFSCLIEAANKGETPWRVIQQRSVQDKQAIKKDLPAWSKASHKIEKAIADFVVGNTHFQSMLISTISQSEDGYKLADMINYSKADALWDLSSGS
jgi:hypothetical protein